MKSIHDKGLGADKVSGGSLEWSGGRGGEEGVCIVPIF